MFDKVKAIPEGYHSVTPYLTIKGAAKALDFYKKVFGAKEIKRIEIPDGKIGHAELQIGDSMIMLADEFPEMGNKSPQSVGGTPVTVHLYVEDVDAVAERAVAAGATLKRPVQDQFYGDRSCTLFDPFGHMWYVSTHIEDMSAEEMQRRSKTMMAQHADKGKSV
jgi:PhnB protein